MSDAGDHPIERGIQLILDDAQRQLPKAGEIPAGRYRPANFDEDATLRRGQDAESEPSGDGAPRNEDELGSDGTPAMAPSSAKSRVSIACSLCTANAREGESNRAGWQRGARTTVIDQPRGADARRSEETKVADDETPGQMLHRLLLAKDLLRSRGRWQGRRPSTRAAYEEITATMQGVPRDNRARIAQFDAELAQLKALGARRPGRDA